MGITIVGAGLAGCEAANLIANAGFKVKLYEMKPLYRSKAHKTDNFAELVCSNSFKAARINSAAGLLKWEMKQLGSLCVTVAEKTAVAAGGALAVDRELFSGCVTKAIRENPNIEVIGSRVEQIPDDDFVIIATGPLTDGPLAESISRLVNSQYLNFYDAAAPIVIADSINYDKVFSASRYSDGEGDYINCPMNKSEYERFYNALVSAQVAPLHEFDKDLTVYEGCMPIEVLAKRGEDSIRFGPMKPVGLVDPRTGHRPWANVQLRKENSPTTMYNIVGFQTNLKFGEQKRVFSMIPGLENAEFARYGVMHRNSFINSPKLLNSDFSLNNSPNVYFSGQISGVEGYMESAMSGIVSAHSVIRKLKGETPIKFPPYTMIGALTGYISDCSVQNFQPMGANFGIVPSLDVRIKDKKERYSALSQRSVDWFNNKLFK
ncbi:MAG: methylenetetrahydrofolate--tRNA-(uracil(54)-C(5))-methyltransferase (FADH(2)-oxidizing) TrmFO [bacterium]|nr:methylenetetrahydrofolate--tRNA-(uracil(54)-C(5))-methyltransferase (FADH(2)-oxidizing) TrmFO [bacterium]